MKSKLFAIAILLVSFVSFGFAQETMTTPTIKLEQTTGKFTVQSLTLEAGTYLFEIANVGVDHELGFVIAPKGKSAQEHHIKEAYVLKTIKDGESSLTQKVTLTKGEYIYFCPLNPTEQYSLTVK
jgi:hypothetical protein